MPEMLCGLKARILEGEELKEAQSHQPNIKGDLALIDELNNIIPVMYLEKEELIYNFDFRRSDIFLLGYPKSGTTWLQEIVFGMVKNPNSEISKLEIPSDVKVPFFEMDCGIPRNSPHFQAFVQLFVKFANADPSVPQLVDIYKNMKDPRIFKTHLPYLLTNPKLLETSKIIYIIRNPIDVFLSLFNYINLIKLFKFEGSIDDFAERFMSGKVFGGAPDQHLRNWWSHRHHPNMHVVFYEDLKANTSVEFKKISAFLGLELTDEQHENVIRDTLFVNMKERFKELENDDEFREVVYSEEKYKESGGFCRKGKVGDSKEKLSPELYKRLSKYFEEKLKDLELPYGFST